MTTRYDLAIIGGGSAGLTAARFANRLGKSAALIEANRLGGDCTWTGCVPSKTLLHAANTAHAIRNAPSLGLTPRAPEPAADFPAVTSRIRAVIAQIYAGETPAALRAEGINVIEARGEFIDSRTIAAGNAAITARKFVICTGASPFIPPIPGLDAVPYLTYETFWNLTALPARLIVIGGGPIGCELAQACQRLGSQVTLVEAMPSILPNDDPEAAALVAASLADDGVDLRLSAPVQSVAHDAASGAITVTAGDAALSGAALLVAVGRRPNVSGLALDAAGIAGTAAGITVNDHLRTSVKHIYAAGDCIGGYQFTHYAGYQGAMAVRNALLPGRSRARPACVPWATFTDPEVAQVGHTETTARNRCGDKVRVARWPMAQVDRAVIEGTTAGFIKVMHRPNGKVLGATVVGPRAAELMQGWAYAIQHGITLADVARTMHAYPSLIVGSQQLAWEAYLTRLNSGLSGRLLRWLSR